MALLEIEETTLSYGNRVILITGKYGDGLANPIWEGSYGKVVGTVVDVSSSLPHADHTYISVRWDNKYKNRYVLQDLSRYKNNPTPVMFKGRTGMVVHSFRDHYIINFKEDIKGFSCDGKYKKGSCLIVQKTEIEKVKK